MTDLAQERSITMTMAHDLLDEPLLTWRDLQGNRGMTTLPGWRPRVGNLLTKNSMFPIGVSG